MIQKISSSYQSTNSVSANEITTKIQNAWIQMKERKDLGFLRLPEVQSIEKVEAVARSLRKQFRNLVVLGIGGSGLGARMVEEIFSNPGSKHQVHFCDNVDPIMFKKLMVNLNLKETAFVAVSKSGKTVETLVGVDFVCQYFDQHSMRWTDHFVVVSEVRSNPLSDWARKHNLPLLEIPEDVGGRFSVLSPVGLLPAAFLGVSLGELRKGAQAAFEQEALIVDFCRETLASWKRGEVISLFWNYSSLLKNFGLWLQQLWAESLSKKQDLQGRPGPFASTPLPALGACDQHSLLQQVIEGQKDKWVVFVRVKALHEMDGALFKTQFSELNYFVGKKMGHLLSAEARATQMALSKSHISNLVLEISDFSPCSVGELLMFWQLVVATLGQVMEINAFDQPGVELGKRLARDILQAE